MTMKEYSTFLKAPELELHIQMVWCHILDTRFLTHRLRRCQSYSTAPPNNFYLAYEQTVANKEHNKS